MHLSNVLSILGQLNVQPDYCNDCQVFVESNIFNNTVIHKWSDTIVDKCNLLPESLQSLCKTMATNAANNILDTVFEDHGEYCKNVQLCEEIATDIKPIDSCNACVNMVADFQYMSVNDEEVFEKLYDQLAETICDAKSIHMAYSKKLTYSQDENGICFERFKLLEPTAKKIIVDQEAKDVCAKVYMCTSE